MKAHGFQFPPDLAPDAPYAPCVRCGRPSVDRLHDSWHLRLLWHPLALPAAFVVPVAIAALILAALGKL